MHKLKTTIKKIQWPSFKSVISDTCYVVITSGILSMLIFGLNFLVGTLTSQL